MLRISEAIEPGGSPILCLLIKLTSARGKNRSGCWDPLKSGDEAIGDKTGGTMEGGPDAETNVLVELSPKTVESSDFSVLSFGDN